jgi:hypothetical protein
MKPLKKDSQTPQDVSEGPSEDGGGAETAVGERQRKTKRARHAPCSYFFYL